METVSLVDFRKNAAQILGRLRQGHSLVLTFRGHPVARLEPVPVEKAGEDDPLYRLFEAAAEEGGGILSNEEMDGLIYGV